MKTAAERMRDYRARMSEASKAAARDRNRQQQQASRHKWNIARKKDEAFKTKVRMRLMRRKKKEALLVDMDRAIVSPRKVFSSAQALGKAMSRLKRALPKSPRKKAAVVRKLSRDFGNEGGTSKSPKKEPTETEKKVQEFYMSDLISRQLPGRKDYVTVVSVSGEKEKVQKRILVMTVREAYEVFRKEHDVVIGKSKFASLRPRCVMPVSDRDQTVCCCRYHENLELLLEGLRKSSWAVPNAKQLMEQASCRWDKECYFGKCSTCSDVKVVTDQILAQKGQTVGTSERAETGNEEVSYYQWTATNSKELVTCTFPQVREELANQIKSVKRHSFLAKVQLQQIKDLKTKLGESEAIMQEDFSENFCIKQQDEIMSAHWVTESVTLFTAVIYQSGGSTSYVVVSDELHHDKFAVYCFNQAILHHYSSVHGKTVKQLHMFSDGAASQFKNRYTLSTILQPQLIHNSIEHMDWSFFATAHGKGPVDGVGGTVKRTVWRRILQKRVVVNSAKDFAEVARGSCPNVDILFVGKEEVDAGKVKLEAAWQVKAPLAIQHTLHMHYARACQSGDVLEVSDISPFSDMAVPEFREAHSVSTKTDNQDSSTSEMDKAQVPCPSEHHKGNKQQKIKFDF